MPNVDYSQIDELEKNQNDLYAQQEQKQNEIINLGMQKQENLVQREKEQIDEDTTKTNKGLYADYQKQANPYGATQENLASQGLANSGYAESSQVSLYNNYQKNVTDTLIQANKQKAELDFDLNQAWLEADIEKAKNAITMFTQKSEQLLQNYQLRYQVYRDAVADEQWEKSYQLQQQQVNNAQSQWEQEYALSLQKARGSS